MEIFTELNTKSDLSLALGFFDGVHKGHQAVINSAVDFAKQNDVKSAVVTFQDHPCCYFYDVKPQYILQREDRIKLFEEQGADYLYILKFDQCIADMNAFEYLDKILMENFHPSTISTGFNHFFGAKKSGDVNYLKTMQKEFNYKYFEVSPQTIEDELISSTAIRKLLTEGDIELSNRMLGYSFFVKGTVIEGQKIGRTIGFKTANLVYPEELVEIPRGVYCATVDFEDKNYSAIANFGLRPTVSNSETPLLEVHIKDFDEDIYGETIKVNFLKKIRGEKKFSSLDELKEQIQKDVQAC